MYEGKIFYTGTQNNLVSVFKRLTLATELGINGVCWGGKGRAGAGMIIKGPLQRASERRWPG